MIVLGAIAPHSPILAPRVGQDRRDALMNTLMAYQKLAERLYALHTEVLIIISPHAQCYAEAFSANIAENYTGSFKAFGDHETHVSAPSSILVLDRIQSVMRERTSIPFTMTTSPEIDYGISIPLLLLKPTLKNIRIIPISPSHQDAETHVDFGRELKEVLHENTKRIAVLASADLSHKLTKDSPAGFSVEGPAFDAMIRKKLAEQDLEGLLSMDAEAINSAGQCGYNPIMILMGMLSDMKTDYTELCYESPFGVGYLTAMIEPI